MDWETSAAKSWELLDYGPQDPEIEPSLASSDSESSTSEDEDSPAVKGPKKSLPVGEPPKTKAPPFIPAPTSSIPTGPRAMRQPPPPIRGGSHFQSVLQTVPNRQVPPLHAPRGPEARGKYPSVHRGGYPRGGPAQTARRMIKDTLAKERCLRGEEPDEIVPLPGTFAHYKQALENSLKGDPFTAQGKGRSRLAQPEGAFDEICRRFHVHIKPSVGQVDNVHQLLIWGKPDQVAEAQSIILGLINKCDEDLAAWRNQRWRRVENDWPQEEEYEQVQKEHEFMLKELRKAPKESDIRSKLLFTWPSEGPTMQKSLGDGLAKLDSIRAEFNVHVYSKGGVEDCICVASTRKIETGPIVARLRESWKEAVSKLDTRVKLYLVEIPPPELFRDSIKLVQGEHGSKALLHGDPLSEAETGELRTQMVGLYTTKKELLLSSIQKSLSTIHFFSGYIRMRVHFGIFTLQSFRKLQGGQTGYRLAQFQEMLFHERAKGRLLPGLKIDTEELLDRCSQASDLLEPLDTALPLRRLREMEPSHSATFEYRTNTDALLRLDTDFKATPGIWENEACNGRWFKACQRNEGTARQLPMQIGKVNFTKSDWQCDIEIFESLGPNIDAAMQSFAAAIVFVNGPHSTCRDIAFKPRKNVIIPPDAPVTKFVEKAALQFRIKGTSYILELARFDEYQRYSTTHDEWLRTPIQSWCATMFDPRWDTLLGGEVKPNTVRTARHGGGLPAFFQSSTGTGGDNGERGFWEFMRVVNRVAVLLGPSRQKFQSEDEKAELLNVDLGTLF